MLHISGINTFFLACVLLVSAGCDNRSEYKKMLDRELDRGVRVDTLFLGYALGMPKEAFYSHSWALNRQGLVMQGPQNQSVQYELEDDLPYAATMLYYPDFHADKVYQMRVQFLYDGWAPWNRDMSSDSLLLDVVALFEQWYGGLFIEHAFSQGVRRRGPEYVSVDGSRRIVVGIHSDREVRAVFTDLYLEQTIQEELHGGE